jgi:hypothetical protein
MQWFIPNFILKSQKIKMIELSPYKLIYHYVPAQKEIMLSISENGIIIHKIQITGILDTSNFITFIRKLKNEDIRDIIYYNITII